MSRSKAGRRAFRVRIDYKNPWYSKGQKEYQHGLVRHHFQRVTRYILDALERYAPPRPCILDAGCGDGVTTKVLAEVPGARVTGADYNPLRLRRARKYVPEARFVRADLRAMPFRSGSFDAVLCNQVVEHVREDRAVLRELFRVAKPGGVVIVGVPNEGGPVMRLRNHCIQPEILRTTDHVNFYTHRTIAEKVAAVPGARILTVDSVSGIIIPYTKAHIFLMQFKPMYDLFDRIAQAVPEVAGSVFVVARNGKAR